MKKYGLKGNLGSTKAKVLLKYIYDQIHPVVESDKEQEINPTQTQSSSSGEWKIKRFLLFKNCRFHDNTLEC